MFGPRFYIESFSCTVRSTSRQYSWSIVVPRLRKRSTISADDSKCSSVINSISDCESLQEDLDNFQHWSTDRRLKFNTSKCEVLTVTRKRQPLRLKNMWQKLKILQCMYLMI